MYRGFSIELDECESLLKDIAFDDTIDVNKEDNDQLKTSLIKQVEKLYIGSSELKSDEIEEDWFPDLKFDIFISHSHRDCDTLVKKFAKWLYDEFGLKAFVDSQVWGNKNDLIQYLAQKDPKGICSTCPDIVTGVNAILNMALLKMMDNTECFMFLSTKNSVIAKSDYTYSPWIYSELEMSNKLRCRMPRRLCNQRQSSSIRAFRQMFLYVQSIPLIYRINRKHLEEITPQQLVEWMQTKRTLGPHNLDYVYNEISQKGFGCLCDNYCVPCDFIEFEGLIIDYLNSQKESIIDDNLEVEFYRKIGGCLQNFPDSQIRELGNYLKAKYGEPLSQSNLLASKRFACLEDCCFQGMNWKEIKRELK